jgi:hypothetical protein
MFNHSNKNFESRLQAADGLQKLPEGGTQNFDIVINKAFL